jgi:CBS domain-containing protein/gamma-glutamyl:cysteine ligase YbdK (ATP-grasp superfamily)
MEDTRAHKTTTGGLSGDDRRRYMRALLTDLRALERMLEAGMFERGQVMIGAEQEIFLVDAAYHPTPAVMDMLERVGSQHFTTELGKFQLEMNSDPQPLAGAGLAALEGQINELYGKVWKASEELGIQPVLTGILPTIDKGDLGLDMMTPNPRYMTLNRVMSALRGGPYDVSIKGIDELLVQHDSIMTEACNASFQVHLQISEPERFAHYYNVAQMLAAPVLAAGTNSPSLFGRRLWAETRIALFQQSCDIRPPGSTLREQVARVSFGKDWVKGSVLDIYKENVTRFRALVGTDTYENSLRTLEKGGVPDLKALRLHNGTVYRWNRACYGISPNGKPHLRIELRVLPSGPTIADEVANAALWLGLMCELVATMPDVPSQMEFDHASSNFDAAARDGLSARLTWLGGREVQAQALLLDELLPLAEKGLARAKVNDADAKRYLGIVENRVRTMRTGSRWMLHSLAEMKDKGSPGERLTALVAATIARQNSGRVVAEWDRARLDEAVEKKSSYHKVSQYMTTDLFTVEPDDPVDLVADLMSWERIHHVPVEEAGRLVGLVTARMVMKHFTELAKSGGVPVRVATGHSSTTIMSAGTPVADVMRRELVTVTPETPTLEAIALMRKHRIGCLPVLEHGHLVGIVTEEDFMSIAAELLEEKIGKVDVPAPPRGREQDRDPHRDRSGT